MLDKAPGISIVGAAAPSTLSRIQIMAAACFESNPLAFRLPEHRVSKS
jgi:hypothetical protein